MRNTARFQRNFLLKLAMINRDHIGGSGAITPIGAIRPLHFWPEKNNLNLNFVLDLKESKSLFRSHLFIFRISKQTRAEVLSSFISGEMNVLKNLNKRPACLSSRIRLDRNRTCRKPKNQI